MTPESASVVPPSACRFLIALFLLLGVTTATGEPPRADDAKMRNRAIELCAQSNFAAALPILEKLAKAHPFDVSILERLGGALMGTAAKTSDPKARKQIMLRARRLFLRAKELGDKSEYITTMLERLPEDGEVPAASPER